MRGVPKAAALAGCLAFVVLLGACSRGAYRIEVFPEMHYQQSYRSQEAPRLSPPGDAVPVTGKEVVYATIQDATGLVNPLPHTPETLDEGKRLFAINCSMCHGQAGRGDGVLVTYFQQAGKVPPFDLVAVTQARSEGQMFWLVTNGGQLNMPSFGKLLTPEQRWAIIYYVRSLAGK